MVPKNLSVCLSVTNFDPKYISLSVKEWVYLLGIPKSSTQVVTLPHPEVAQLHPGTPIKFSISSDIFQAIRELLAERPALTFGVPTRDNPVLDPLAAQHHQPTIYTS